MDPLTQFKKIPILLLLIALALVAPTAGTEGAAISDFNGDGYPDYVLQNNNTNQTAIWYLNKNVFISGAFGPTLPSPTLPISWWALVDVVDFNRDGHPDYVLFNFMTGAETAIWYLSGRTLVGSAHGPTIPSLGLWSWVGAGDFNGDGKLDYLLYNGSTRQTAIWYLNNNVFVSGSYGPTLPVGWSLLGAADFNGDGHPDYVLENGRGRTAIWYLSGRTRIGSAYGPSVPSGWTWAATADFNGDGHPDYVLYKPGSNFAAPTPTAIWYLNNNVFISSAYGPALPAGWTFPGVLGQVCAGCWDY